MVTEEYAQYFQNLVWATRQLTSRNLEVYPASKDSHLFSENKQTDIRINKAILWNDLNTVFKLHRY